MQPRSACPASVPVACVVALLVGSLTASAREWFVDQSHGRAGDASPGTEAEPLKTIQAAANAAKPGDVVWVKQGVYEEETRIATSGTIHAPITISAWRDDRVRIGSVLRELPPAEKWAQIPGSKSWATQLPADSPDNPMVILDDKPIVTQLRDTPPRDEDEKWATYRKSDRTLMINASGVNPAANHKLRLARDFTGFVLTESAGFWQFRKLEFSRLYAGFVTVGHGYLIEDCYFNGTYREAIFLHGRLTTIRRCNFHKCGYAIAASGSGPANIIEDCLFVECGQDWQEDVRHRAMNLPEGLGPLTFKGDAFAQIFRYNIVADNQAGLWYDGSATGARVLGNAFWDNRYGQGIYNEYSSDDVTILGNCFYHASVTSSWCTRMSILDNFFEGGCVVWHNRDRWPLRNSFMVLRGNAMVDAPNGYLQHYGPGWGAPQMDHTMATPSFFWRVADGDCNDATLRPYEPWFEHEYRWQPTAMAGYDVGENHGCRWYVDAEEKYPDPNVKFPDQPTNRTELSSGNRWLLMAGVTPEKIPPQGVGYWSAWLATAPGARITVSLRIRGKDLQPTEKGTPAIWLQFINETGQNRRRVYLVGRDELGKERRPELTKGSYDWTTLKETVTAPEGAIRMALFLGVLPCKGEVDFDDIEIKTESASAPPEAEKQEALPPRLPLERLRETFFVDLSKVANRALADDDPNDGKGGWSDQGAGCDMRAFPTGPRKFGGVPFNVLPAPKSIVVLKSTMRAPGDLPEKVTIPVGRKADTLFFLHAAAWAGEGELFRYVIHYQDGKQVTLGVDQKNMADWIAEPVKRFPKEQGTFSTAAETVPSPQFGKGTVYRMEWSAPRDRRTVAIESIEFVGNPKCVPILLAITGVVEW